MDDHAEHGDFWIDQKMADVALNLVVLYCADTERSREFYEALGLRFRKEQHGQGPEHYACELEKTVLELYPRVEGQALTGSVRLGFRVKSIAEVAASLAQLDQRLLSAPRESPWGKRALALDPDRHRIELVEASEANHEPAS